jgi:site-specific DNA-adenine methylase
VFHKEQNYGIPYMGSKSKIIHKISRFFPPADNFYDLFGGGFSVTHFMIEHRKRDFKEFHFKQAACL